MWGTSINLSNKISGNALKIFCILKTCSVKWHLLIFTNGCDFRQNHNLKNMSSELRCMHKGNFQACVWLLWRYFKVKLSVKMEDNWGLCLSSPLGTFRAWPQPPISFLTLWFCYGLRTANVTGTKALCPIKS